MSAYEELVGFVSTISSDAAEVSEQLAALSENIGKHAKSFDALTSSTRDGSAQVVAASFHQAQRSVLEAARALLEAAKTGNEWCGGSQPVKVLVKKR